LIYSNFPLSLNWNYQACDKNDRSKVVGTRSAIVENYFISLLQRDKPLKSGVRKDPQEYQSGSIRAQRVKPVPPSPGIKQIVRHSSSFR
jgi:hypothetical protein